jgi:hypothetical protein
MKTFVLASDRNITAFPSRKAAIASGDPIFSSVEEMDKVLRLAKVTPLESGTRLRASSRSRKSRIGRLEWHVFGSSLPDWRSWPIFARQPSPERPNSRLALRHKRGRCGARAASGNRYSNYSNGLKVRRSTPS